MTDCENEFRSSEAKERQKDAERAFEMVSARLAIAGRLLFSLATGTEVMSFPAMMNECKKATKNMNAWMNVAETRCNRLAERAAELQALCSYYEGRIEQLKDCP